ncbi:MAG TPA: metal-dependent transcriptional regulator [Puia sp.]|jgi:DtxR family Mn-dependent transcriptional regulator|nr:metal-dependent transcriptional regulator [Puia sp.]
MQTFSEENYLKIIYNLDKQGIKKITPTAIAEALDNNPASVIDMLKKLGDKKLLAYEKSKGAKLTPNGKAVAISVIRKHRLWEVFLLEKLGYEWDQVHDIAEQLEHIHYADLADKLDKFLGFPKYDPHGDPIPSANGEMVSMNRFMLEEANVGKTYKVVGVKDTSPEFLQYLKKLEIGIGTKITIKEKIPFDNSMIIMIEKNMRTSVSKIFAQNLLVHE